MKTFEDQKLAFDALAETVRRFISATALAVMATFVWTQLASLWELPELSSGIAMAFWVASMAISGVGLALLSMAALISSLFSAKQLVIALFGQRFSFIGFVLVQFAFYLLLVTMCSGLLVSAYPIFGRELP
jgi:hypothetical protein